MSNVADALSRLTPEQRAILEKKLQQKRAKQEAATTDSSKIQPRPQDAGYPLSAGQERLFMLSQFAPDATTYNITEAVRLRGPLNLPGLEESISQLVERHESIRAAFTEVDGQPAQRILPAHQGQLTITKAMQQGAADTTSAIAKFVSAEQTKPFILHQGPLYRFNLLALSDTDNVLVLTMHHIIADGWSFGVLFQELSNRYAAAVVGESATIEPLPVQYADFAYWQQEWLQSDKAKAQLSFWTETLGPGVESLQLPVPQAQKALSDYARGAHAGAAVQKVLDPALVTALQTTSRGAGMTLFITLLAGFKATLYRYSGQETMVVCSPTVGRKQVETEELLGYFNNIVSIRSDLSGNPEVNQLQARVQESLVAAYDHDELPFQLVASLPHLARISLTRALFTLQDGLNETLALPNIEIEPVKLDSSSSDFDTALYMEWYGDSLVASMEYKTGVMDQATATDFLDNLCDTFQQLADNPAMRLQELTRIDQPISSASSLAQPTMPGGFTENGTNGHHPSEAELAHIVVQNNQHVDHPAVDTQAVNNREPDELEKQLIQIWEEILGLEGIQRTDNFFELGGHSMSALRLFTKIEKEVTQEKLPLALLFQAPTVAEIANVIRSDDSQAAWSLVVPLQEKGSKPPLFCIHAAGGNVLLYSDLARHLASTDQPVYGIQSQGLDGKKPILTTVEEMGEVYVEEILAVQPAGPYLLTGYCLGGTVAFDVAQRLMAKGHQVAFLGLLETYNWANLKGSSLMGNLKYQSQRAEFMVRNFMMLDSEQRQDFFRGKMERVQGRTSVWRGSIQSKLGKNQDEAAKSDDAILAELWESNDEAADAYVPDTYPGKITQFIPAKDYADYNDPALLWDNIAQGGVDVHKLNVYPAGMVYEPFVKTLAQHIAAGIQSGLSAL